MVRYETLFLAVPEITSDEASTLESSFQQILREHKALDISFERWGKYRLAYPVRKNEYGVYFLARFEVDPEAQQATIKSLDLLMKVKLNKLVMRYSTYRLDESEPLAYNRPESLEEVPTRDVDSVLKEGAGLLGQRPHRGRPPRSFAPHSRGASYTAERETVEPVTATSQSRESVAQEAVVGSVDTETAKQAVKEEKQAVQQVFFYLLV